MWCCPVVEVGLKTKHKILIAPTKASVKCVTAYIRLWLVILWLWSVMLLFWLLLRSLVGYCCACGLLMWLCCCAIGDIHSGVNSGCKLVTLLSFLWYDKLWGPSQRVVTLFLSLVKCISKSGQMYFCVWWWLLVEDESWRRGRWVRISVNFHQLDTVKGGRGVQMIFIVFSTNFFSTYRLIEFIHRHLGY